MWKHKNFINLQLCAGEVAYNIPAGTYTFKDTFTVPDDTLTGTFDFKSNDLTFIQIDVYSSKGGSVVFLRTVGDITVASSGSWGDPTYQTIVLEEAAVNVSADFYNWFIANTVSATPTLSFKHFYNAGTIGTGTIKFRHYSQQAPSSGETWVLNESGIGTLARTNVNFTSNNTSFSSIYCQEGKVNELYYQITGGTDIVAYAGSWSNTAYRTITFATSPTGDLLTWLQANGIKQGGGGRAVIKAGTYKWVDTPNIQGITDIIGEDGGLNGQFKSSDITFDTINFNIHNSQVRYDPCENFASLIGDNEVEWCGYIDMQWGVQETYKDVTAIPAIQTFTILEDIDLSSAWNNTEIEQAILSWFTANTTKLS